MKAIGGSMRKSNQSYNSLGMHHLPLLSNSPRHLPFQPQLRSLQPQLRSLLWNRATAKLPQLSRVRVEVMGKAWGTLGRLRLKYLNAAKAVNQFDKYYHQILDCFGHQIFQHRLGDLSIRLIYLISWILGFVAFASLPMEQCPKLLRICWRCGKQRVTVPNLYSDHFE